MAGLLDSIFNSPEGRMGMGLLALGQMPKSQGMAGLMGLLASQDGMVGDSSLPIGMRLAAAQEVKRLQQKYMHLNGGDVGNEQPQQTTQPAQREFSMLPKAADFDGKRMRAPDGTIYRSSGGRWNEE